MGFYHADPWLTDGRSLRLSDDDCLWLGRMCVGERTSRLVHRQNEIAAMLWAMANRYLLYPGRRHWPDFVTMLRGFSQPINPRWMAGGDKAIKYAKSPSASPARLKRRAMISSLPQDKIPKKIRRDIELFREGKLGPPKLFSTVKRCRISNWGSWKNVEHTFPWGINVYGNWMFEDKGLSVGEVLYYQEE